MNPIAVMDHMTTGLPTGPLQHVLDGLCSTRYQPALIRVLQAQDERAAVLLGKDVVVESRSEASEVQETCSTE